MSGRALVRIVLIGIVSFLAPSSAVAQGSPPPGQGAPQGVPTPTTPVGFEMEWLLKGLAGDRPIDATEHMAQSFLDAYPAAQLNSALEQLRQGSRGFVPVRHDEKGPHTLQTIARVVADGSYWRIAMSVEAQPPHRMTTLLFQPAPEETIPVPASWEEAQRIVQGFGPRVALACYRVDGEGGLEPVFEHNAGATMAIGSAFKLFVLGALADMIVNEREGWNEPLMVDNRFKSLPSGRMHMTPAGTEEEIVNYARLMIAISDNTAADHLANLVGRDVLEDYYKKRVAGHALTLPFLLTREIFVIKLDPEGDLLHRYAAADEAGRRALLADVVSTKEPNIIHAGNWTAPREIERVEWFATARELCAMMAELRELSEEPRMDPIMEIMTANPGVRLDPDVWGKVMYKGGSEPGVMNLTWLAERKARDPEAPSDWFALCVTVNDPASVLQEMSIAGAGQRILEMLAAQR